MKVRSSLTIGNDIVDFRTLEPPLHPRYLERVFTPKEQHCIGTSVEELWVHWAAKEAAYKALKRLEPGLPFIPRKFELHRERSVVTQGKYELYAHCRLGPDCVHVSCVNHETFLTGSIQEWIDETQDASLEGPSAEVRKLAIHKLAQHFQIHENDIIIYKQAASSVPYVSVRGVHFMPVLSLTHHGRFIGCCFAHSIELRTELPNT